MLQIHPNARTTPVTRAEIANSHERSGVLAQRYGVGVSKTWGYAASWIVRYHVATATKLDGLCGLGHVPYMFCRSS